MTETRYADIRQLMKRVEQLVREIQSADEVGITIYNLADAIIARFRDALGLYGGRLYQWDGEAYELKATFPNAKPAEREIRVPATYAPIEIALAEGVVYMGPDDPRFDHKFEDQIGVDRFAAIEVGDEEFILSFDLAPESHRDDVLFSLGVLRHAINQKLRQERMQEVFDQARKIQASILPRRTPVYGGFELYGRIQPMESVGGDFYDYIPITDKILGLAIADVSGHGLPAALQVRDIYMGLRMGMARDFKIVRTVERLNQIIHKSTLTSRFVSMFYGELEPNGVFIYVNAGHSYGGGLALYLASRHPERIERLLLVDNTLPIYASQRRKGLFRWRWIAGFAAHTFALSDSVIEKGLKAAYFDDARVTPGLVRDYAERLRIEGVTDAFFGLVGPSQEPPYRIDLAKVEIPTLVLWGAEDRLIEATAAEKTSRQLPDARFVVLPACGHTPMEECPEAFLDAALPFLTGAEAAAAGSP